MSRPATTRLKVNPPIGLMPALQYLLPAQMKVDHSYQRDLNTGTSATLIRRIAPHWNWDLCQPLVVARRENGDLFVIDGQHRLEAARMRGDIAQLPAVVVQYASAADEAASFVHLNQQRRPLTKLDLFKAALASEDPEAVAIVAALDAAGLSIAPHSNFTAWKPGMVSNVGGIEASWRQNGAKPTAAALRALGAGFTGQVLRYAGTIFPGIAAICVQEMQGADGFADNPELWDMLVEMLASSSQEQWRNEILQARMDDPNLNYRGASETVLLSSWGELLSAFLDDKAA